MLQPSQRLGMNCLSAARRLPGAGPLVDVAAEKEYSSRPISSAIIRPYIVDEHLLTL
jgi:hypothetical protein